MTPREAGATAWDRDRTTVHIPDPAVEVLDARFEALVLRAAVVERLWTGGMWLEGPVWFGDGRYLLFSDIPADRILRWDEPTGGVGVWRQPSNNANGATRDAAGRLISCEHDSRRVTRTELDGGVTVLADAFDGMPLCAPNDVVATADGAIWFTNPGWGVETEFEGHRAVQQNPRRAYRIDPASGAVEAVVTDMDRPNGLAFSPGESLLYVVDDDIRVYDVEDGRPVRGRLFASMGEGAGDGIRVDVHGNVWAGASGGGPGYDGVHCFAPDGTEIGRIHLPEGCANVCFGGAKKNRLFMTASRSLYAVHLNTRGLQEP